MELFMHTHTKEDPDLIEIEESAKVRDLVLESEPEGKIWLQDADDEIDLDLTLKDAGIGHRHHLHRGHCKRVEVVVRFNGVEHRESYAPGTVIKSVYRWAAGDRGFNLSPDQAAKHVLVVPGADHFLSDNVHIGSLAGAKTCLVTLDLVPRERYEG
jgi:hypothetical protein